MCLHDVDGLRTHFGSAGQLVFSYRYMRKRWTNAIGENLFAGLESTGFDGYTGCHQTPFLLTRAGNSAVFPRGQGVGVASSKTTRPSVSEQPKNV